MIDSVSDGLRAQIACMWEATARKVGNVHPQAAFADMEYMHFLLSASAMQAPFTLFSGSGVAELVYQAVQSTRTLVPTNTNLGIILLLAPLSAASWDRVDYRGRLRQVLDDLTVADARIVYEAIRLAKPGGLAETPEQDIRSEPTVTLLEAMKLAADRDMIARQYARGFTDVFDFGVPAFVKAFASHRCIEAAIIDCQLRWLAEFPDSLICRKNGLPAAEDVQSRARNVLALGGIATADGRRASQSLDRDLRVGGHRLNPGTTADLVTACLFIALRDNKVLLSSPFRWDAPDWLAP